MVNKHTSLRAIERKLKIISFWTVYTLAGRINECKFRNNNYIQFCFAHELIIMTSFRYTHISFNKTNDFIIRVSCLNIDYNQIFCSQHSQGLYKVSVIYVRNRFKGFAFIITKAMYVAVNIYVPLNN